MENMENTQQAENPVTIDRQIKDYLTETSKWGKFLAIVGYIGVGVLILMGLAVIVASSALSSLAGITFPFGIMGIFYFLGAVLYYFPVTYMYRFSSHIKEGLVSGNQEPLTSGFKNLKSMFRFAGIITIVILSLDALALILIIPIALIFHG